ncbi:CLUMA_CG014237, isoform A [Clunio marinus]|uniref:Carboxylic ester hydrolase n=1 Tax=Clunio marinus TaxID=568069 RepID=A0A1J1IPZ6_9DIPT|nr:CLUMA_CG014237, isoform A [Clunio marinus]
MRLISNVSILILIISQGFCEIVEISDGKVSGIVMKTRYDENFHAYMGIPYAEKPLGDKRFRAPIKVSSWSGVLNATEFSPMCMQVNLLSQSPVAEDCLYLNVFTKNLPLSRENETLQPVVVYIHGGSFQLGSASDHKPHLLMERNVVLVSFNYRLGAFGFLSLGNEEIPGNAGFKDQVMVLEWVQNNIHHFGGDPKLVTLMGNSAGAYGVTAHMVSSMSKGLFHRVVALSGSITYQRKLEDNYLDLGRRLAEKMNCTVSDIDEMIKCLREKPAVDFNLIELREYPQCTIMTWFPVIEKDFGQRRFLSDDPKKLFQSANFSKVPIIIGRTKDEFVDIPSRMIQFPIIDELNQRYDEVAPHCFFYETNTEKSRSQTLKDVYFPYDVIDIKSLSSLSQIFSDGYIGYPVHKLAHLISNLTDVFYYQLSFIGRYSFFLHPHDKPYGVHHSDEMQYILETVFVGPRIELNDPENVMVERFTRIIYQFASSGDPNDKNDDYLNEMFWPKHDSINEFYLDIGSHFIEKHGLALDRYAAWDELENDASVIFKFEIIQLLLASVMLIKLF